MSTDVGAIVSAYPPPRRATSSRAPSAVRSRHTWRCSAFARPGGTSSPHNASTRWSSFNASPHRSASAARSICTRRPGIASVTPASSSTSRDPSRQISTFGTLRRTALAVNLGPRPDVSPDVIWKHNPPSGLSRPAVESDTFHDWILSLPWVVERPYVAGVRGVRAFAIDCQPLDIHRMWLVTGLPHGRGIALIVEDSRAERYESVGVASPITPMPARHTLVGLSEDLGGIDVEHVIFDVYASLLS